MRTFVKLGGITEERAVKLVPSGGAAGFVIGVPSSPRNLTPSAAATLVTSLPTEAEAWAVVSNPSAELIHQLFDEVGVDRVQVYGAIPEGLEYLEIHHLVPSLAVPPAGSDAPDPTVPPAEDYSRLHLDLLGDPLPGGSAEPADWERCTRLVDQNPGRKLVLAGGLSVENVADVMAFVRPWGLDVTKSVEFAPGRIDPGKVEAFLKAVEATEAPAK